MFHIVETRINVTLCYVIADCARCSDTLLKLIWYYYMHVSYTCIIAYCNGMMTFVRTYEVTYFIVAKYREIAMHNHRYNANKPTFSVGLFFLSYFLFVFFFIQHSLVPHSSRVLSYFDYYIHMFNACVCACAQNKCATHSYTRIKHGLGHGIYIRVCSFFISVWKVHQNKMIYGLCFIGQTRKGRMTSFW